MSKPEGDKNIDLTKAQAVQVDLNGNARRLTLADVMEQQVQNNREHVNRVMQGLPGGHNNLLNIMPIVEPPERIEAANSVEAGTYRDIASAATPFLYPRAEQDDAVEAMRGAAGYFNTRGGGFDTNPRVGEGPTVSDALLLAQRRQQLTDRIHELGMSVTEANMVTDGERVWNVGILAYDEWNWQRMLEEIPQRFRGTYSRLP